MAESLVPAAGGRKWREASRITNSAHCTVTCTPHRWRRRTKMRESAAPDKGASSQMCWQETPICAHPHPPLHCRVPPTTLRAVLPTLHCPQHRRRQLCSAAGSLPTYHYHFVCSPPLHPYGPCPARTPPYLTRATPSSARQCPPRHCPAQPFGPFSSAGRHHGNDLLRQGSADGVAHVEDTDVAGHAVPRKKHLRLRRRRPWRDREAQAVQGWVGQRELCVTAR